MFWNYVESIFFSRSSFFLTLLPTILIVNQKKVCSTAQLCQHMQELTENYVEVMWGKVEKNWSVFNLTRDETFSTDQFRFRIYQPWSGMFQLSLVDVAGKTSMNLHVSKQTLQDFPWFRQKFTCFFLSDADNFCEILSCNTENFHELCPKLTKFDFSVCSPILQNFVGIMEIFHAFHKIHANKFCYGDNLIISRIFHYDLWKVSHVL